MASLYAPPVRPKLRRRLRLASSKPFQPANFIIDVPLGLLEILDGVPFVEMAPDVFDGVADVEVHMAGDFDTLDAAGVLAVVAWVDGVFRRSRLIVLWSR